MITFVVLAAALTVAVVIAVAAPLLRGGRTEAAPAPWAAVAAGAVLVVGAALLYVAWSNWSWRAAVPADSPQTMVAHLARQLEQDPKNLDGWLMLGRSYVVLHEYPLALRAFQRADRLSGGKSEEALMGQAEALALPDDSELSGRAGRLVERALVLAPDSGKALFFGAAVAARRGELPLARARFAKLLEMNPPANIRPLIEQQLSALDDKLAGSATVAPAAAGEPPAPPGSDGAAVRVNVTLAASVPVGPAAPLFVFVRQAGAPGPPLAAKRLDSHFPQAVTLTPADSMLPGRSFAAGQSVQVVARIARSGSPVGATGDPVGEVTYRVGQDQVVNLVIDRLTP